ncbi:MAG: ribulose-phosphate 3-epimerase [Alistipes sp.]|nr:ribulose-phosphate 3-epimerase [Alistipes sp.]
MARIISPSMLSADFGNLERDSKMIDRSRAQWFHIDVMDGVFVPNISFGFPVLAAITKTTDKVIDTHLMIIEPEKYVERFVKAGSHYVTFHIEATDKVQECIDLIHAAGAKAGISIKPNTPVEVLKEWLPKIELVLIMSVEPGFGGQSFIEGSTQKVAELKALIGELGLDVLIEVDGGISSKNARELYDAGADALVAGSAVFKAPSPEQEIIDILEA